MLPKTEIKIKNHQTLLDGVTQRPSTRSIYPSLLRYPAGMRVVSIRVVRDTKEDIEGSVLQKQKTKRKSTDRTPQAEFMIILWGSRRLKKIFYWLPLVAASKRTPA